VAVCLRDIWSVPEELTMAGVKLVDGIPVGVLSLATRLQPSGLIRGIFPAIVILLSHTHYKHTHTQSYTLQVHTHTQSYTLQAHTYRHRERYTDRHTKTQTDTLRHRQTHRHRQKDRRTHKLTRTHTRAHIDTPLYFI
jgi:hypothetical protein